MKSYILKLQHDQKPLETSLEDKIINSLNHKCIFFPLLNHVNVEKDYSNYIVSYKGNLKMCKKELKTILETYKETGLIYKIEKII